MKMVMRHFAAKANQGHGQLPFCNYWGGMGWPQFTWALLPSFCLQDRQVWSTFSSQERAEHGRGKRSDRGPHALSSSVHSHDGDGEGTEAVVVSSDSHSERGILNAHPSQWRYVRLDKVSHGISLFQPHLSYMSASFVPGSVLGLEPQLRPRGFP